MLELLDQRVYVNSQLERLRTISAHREEHIIYEEDLHQVAEGVSATVRIGSTANDPQQLAEVVVADVGVGTAAVTSVGSSVAGGSSSISSSSSSSGTDIGAGASAAVCGSAAYSQV